MNELALSPYFHPTTICFLDDNESFLQSLDLELPGNWACRTFTDPMVALNYLRQPAPQKPLMDRCFSLRREDPAHAVVHLDLGLIEQEISHVHRFNRNSVVVVDYAMPSMNGLDFCAALDDSNIRKAMLTGVADEKLAVQAFNAGLIHRFIPKQAADPVGLVRKFVTELLHDYFNQYTARLKATLAIDPPPLLVDPVVANYVQELMVRENLVEYYLVDDPPGLMMLKADGTIYRVAILNEREMQAQVARASAFGAPEQIRQQLALGNAIVFLSGLIPADYFGDEDFPWEEQLQPATTLGGGQGGWYVAIWKDAPGDINFDPANASYDAYLRSL